MSTKQASSGAIALAGVIGHVARLHGIDPLVAWAIAQQESAGRIEAYRYEPRWRWFTNSAGEPLGCGRDEAQKRLDPTEFHSQSASWGLMQVMGSVARELGLVHRPIASILCNPYLATHLGCKKLAQLASKYGELGDDAISAYNDGDDYRTQDNPHYVNGVREHMRIASLDTPLLKSLHGTEEAPPICNL